MKKLEPVDALVLKVMLRKGGVLPAHEEGVLNNEILDNILLEVALANLTQLGIIIRNASTRDLYTTAKGKLLLRAVEP